MTERKPHNIIRPVAASPTDTRNLSKSYYFSHRRTSSRSSEHSVESFGFTTSPSFAEVPSGDKDEVIEKLPDGATRDEFASRPVMDAIREVADESRSADAADGDAAIGSLLLLRKVPVKVEPKVFMANERTLLAWLHAAVWLFGAAVTIIKLADANRFSHLYGIILLPVAVIFTCYAIYIHNKRARMIRVKHPGPYEDLVGPALLGVVLMIAIVAEFSVKMYSLWY